MPETRSIPFSPKTSLAREKLLQRILRGSYSVGQRIPTEPLLVEELGVSRNTIREAVASLIHDGLLERRQGSGTYVVNNQPITSRPIFKCDTIRMGISVGPFENARHPSLFLLELMKGISEPVPGYPKLDVRYLTADPSYRNIGGIHFLDAVRSGTIDMLILAWFEREDREIERLIAEGFPMMIVGIESPWKQVPFVHWDLAAGVRKLVTFLFRNGSTNIGLLLDKPRGGSAVAFLSGTVAGMASLGLPPDVSRTAYTERDSSNIPRAVDTLLEQGTTTLICYDDDTAAEVVRYLQSKNLRVPEDIIVTGANDTPLPKETRCPPLTTLRVPLVEIGKTARDLAFEGARVGRIPAQNIQFDPELIVRQSAPARNLSETCETHET